MSMKQIASGVYQLSLGMVNVFLLDQDGVTLIDSGMPGSALKILAALGEIGRRPMDVRQILVTHLHGDHTGSLKALQTELPSARIKMHALEAEVYQQGKVMRPSKPAPGLLGILIGGLIGKAGPSVVEPARVDACIADGEEIPYTGGLRAVHTPGHTAGHLAFLWPQAGGLLITGDAARHMRGLAYPFIFEDIEVGKASLRKLAGQAFEKAVFSHGGPMLARASQQFRKKWG